MAYLESSHRIYLVDFHGVSQHFIFNDKKEQLGDLIELHGTHGVERIKQYVPHKGTFKTMSKKEVQSWFDWDTHSIEQLKKVNFI